MLTVNSPTSFGLVRSSNTTVLLCYQRRTLGRLQLAPNPGIGSPQISLVMNKNIAS